MGTLIRMEWRRFRGHALVWALVHTAVLALVAVYDELFVPSPAKVRLGAVAYALAGLLLGLYQIGGYRRRHLWSFLLHRPLAPGRIFLSLAAAAGLVLGIVVALPFLLVTVSLDGLSSQWVDLRHYLLVPFLWGLALVFYCGGAFLALRKRWSAALVLVLVVPFLNGAFPGAWVFLPLLVALLWLSFAARTAFQPDLEGPPQGLPATLAQALPTQAALFPVLVLAMTLLYSVIVVHREAGWRGFTVFGWNDYFPVGSYERAFYQGGADLVAHGLRLADTPRSRDLLESLSAAQATAEEDSAMALFRPQATAAPRRHALLFQEPIPESPAPQGIRWIFSHDRMQFFGRDGRTGAWVGWLGPEGRDQPAPFASVATLSGRWILAGESLYRMDPFEMDPFEEEVDRKLRLPDGERLITPVVGWGQGQALLSRRALYLFADRRWNGPPRGIPLPGAVENLERASVVPLRESALVTFLMGRLSERDAYPARLVQLEVSLTGEGGEITPVTDQPLTPGPPAWVRHRGFLVSPLWQAIVDGVQRDPAAPRWSQMPLPLWSGALALALLSAVVTVWLARRRRLPPRSLWGWTALAFLAGLPGCLSFLLLVPRSEV